MMSSKLTGRAEVASIGDRDHGGTRAPSSLTIFVQEHGCINSMSVVGFGKKCFNMQSSSVVPVGQQIP